MAVFGRPRGGGGRASPRAEATNCSYPVHGRRGAPGPRHTTHHWRMPSETAQFEYGSPPIVYPGGQISCGTRVWERLRAGPGAGLSDLGLVEARLMGRWRAAVPG